MSARALVLPIILLLALGLRLWGVTRQGIWFDEAVLACFAELSTAEWFSYLRDTVPGFFWIALIKAPLFILLLRGWTGLLGASEVALRLPSLLLGLLAIVLLHRLAARLLDGPRAAWAALLLCLNPFAVYYSQQCTEYNLLLCVGLGSMLLWLRERQDGAAPWARVAVNLAGLGVHPMAALVPGVQLLLRIGRGRVGVRPGALLELLPLALVVGYGVVLAAQPSEVSLTLGWVAALGWSGGLELLGQLLHGGMVHGHLAREQAAAVQWATLAGMSALILAGIAALRRDRATLATLLTWTLAPVVAVAGFSLVSRSLWVPRYLVFVLPPLLLLAACGLHAAARRLGGRGLPGVAMAGAAPVLLLLACLHLHNRPPEGAFRELAPALRAQLRPGDGVVLSPDRIVLPFGYYWDGRLGRWLDHLEAVHRRIPADARFINTDYHASGRRLETEDAYRAWARRRVRVWVVAVDDWPGDQQTASLVAHLKQRRPELSREHFAYSGAALILFGEPRP